MKKVFLTGSSGGIGKAIKNVFEENGFTVVTPKRDQLNLEGIISVRNFYTLDLKFDIIGHSAGFNTPKLIDELTFEDIEKTAKIILKIQ